MVASLRDEVAHLRSPSNPHHLSARAWARAIARAERHLAFFIEKGRTLSDNAETATVTFTVAEVRFLDWYLNYPRKQDEAECNAIRLKLQEAIKAQQHK